MDQKANSINMKWHGVDVELKASEVDDLLKRAMREHGYTEVVLEDGTVEAL